MGSTRQPCIGVQDATFVVTNDLELERIKKLSIEIVFFVISWWLDSYVASIDAASHMMEGRGASQTGKPSTNLLQLVWRWKMDDALKDLHDAISNPVHHVVYGSAGNIKGL